MDSLRNKWMLLRYKYDLLAITTFIVLASILFRNVLFKEGIIEFGDFTVPSTLENYLHFYYPLWNDFGSFSTFQYTNRLLTYGPFLLISRFAGIDIGVIVKFFALFPIVLSFISMYIASSILITTTDGNTNNNYTVFAKFFASCVFALNPWIIIETTHFSLIWGYAFAPLILVTFYTYLNSKNVNQFIIVTVLMTFASVTPHWVVFYGLLLVSILLYFSALQFSKKKYNLIISYVKKFFVVMGAYLLLNSYWIVTFILSSRYDSVSPTYITSNEVIDMLSRNSDFINVIQLNSGWWPQVDPAFHSYESIWIVASFVLLILTVITLIFEPKNRIVNYFGFLCIIAITLSMGSKSAFGDLYHFVSFDVPGFSSRFGWVFRNPAKWTSLIALAYSFMIFVFLNNVCIKKCHRNKSAKYLFVACVIILTSIFLFFVSATINGYSNEILNPVQIPEEYNKTNIWLTKQDGDFKTMWLPPYNGRKSTWSDGHMLGSFDTMSSSIPTFSSGDPDTSYYLYYLYNNYISYNFSKYIAFLNIRYLMYHQDVPGGEELQNISHDESLQKIKSYGFISIFENSEYAPHINIISRNVVILDGLDKFSSLINMVNFSLLNTSVYFPEQVIKSEFGVENSDIVILKNNLHTISVDNKYLIKPFDRTTHHDPAKVWSKAATNEPLHGPWHYYLTKRGIENWDFDYGKGIIFTWSDSIIDEKVNSSEKDLLSAYYFENSFDGWDINGKDIQSKELSSDSHSGKQSFQVTLNESKPGWKTANSPLLSASYSITYKWIFNVKAENAEKFHLKIVEYDVEKKIINSKQVASLGTGTFGWKEVSFEFKPTDKRVAYMQLQIWHGHETKQPLPNKVWIDDVKVYDLTRYIEPVTIDMNANVDNDGAYELFVRYFKNKDGGRIELSIDGESIRRIDTSDQLNKFVWEKAATLYLKKGMHKLTLTNADGFNAVNLFALIPEKEYKEMEAKTESLLEGKRLMYILEAESDLYRTEAPLSKKYGVDASNGGVLEFNKTSKAWQTVSIMRPDNYTMALKLNGDFDIKVDETNYNVISNNSGFAYIGPLSLEKGDHKIEIALKTNGMNRSYLDVVWLYSTNRAGETLDDVFTVNEKPATVSNYNKIDPTLYKMNVKATKPFMLAFAESYDPLWYARVDKINGKSVKSEMVRPVPLYSVINGFWINETGDLDITFEYEPQKWFYAGAAISLTTLLLCFIYLVYYCCRNRKKKENRPMRQRKRNNINVIAWKSFLRKE